MLALNGGILDILGTEGTLLHEESFYYGLRLSKREWRQWGNQKKSSLRAMLNCCSEA